MPATMAEKSSRRTRSAAAGVCESVEGEEERRRARRRSDTRVEKVESAGRARTFHRDLGPACDCDADVGLLERCAVVDAVAGNGDRLACGLEALDDLELLLRRRAGEDDLVELLQDAAKGQFKSRRSSA